MAAEAILKIPNNVNNGLGYKDTKAWKRGMELARLIFSLTENLRDDDAKTLLSELRKQALNVPTRIAQGHSKGSAAEYLRTLAEARSAMAAIDTQTTLAHQMNFIDFDDRRRIEILMYEIRYLIDQLTRKLL